MVLGIGALLTAAGCGLFEPRSPEPPTAPSDSFRPASDPDVLIENFQGAIAQKNTVNYMRCLADPAQAGRPFLFIPSAGAAATYAGVFTHWGIDEERQYFQNLVARSAGKPSAYANLLLSHKTVLIAGDSSVYTYDYTLTFEHPDAGFPQSATGTIQLVMGPDNTNAWVIYRWTDFKTTGDVTWSHFKGKFSN